MATRCPSKESRRAEISVKVGRRMGFLCQHSRIRSANRGDVCDGMMGLCRYEEILMQKPNKRAHNCELYIFDNFILLLAVTWLGWKLNYRVTSVHCCYWDWMPYGKHCMTQRQVSLAVSPRHWHRQFVWWPLLGLRLNQQKIISAIRKPLVSGLSHLCHHFKAVITLMKKMLFVSKLFWVSPPLHITLMLSE